MSNEDHPMRQEGTFSEPTIGFTDRFIAKIHLRVEQFNRILEINEALSVTFWITMGVIFFTIIVSAICIGHDQYTAPFYEATERLQECNKNRETAEQRNDMYEEFLSRSVIEEGLFR